MTLSTGVTRMAAETMPKYRPCRVTAMDLRHFSVLLPLEADEDPETVLAPILKTAGQILYNYFSTAIYWAVGRPVNDILKISESQHDAFAALPLLHEASRWPSTMKAPTPSWITARRSSGRCSSTSAIICPSG